MSDGMQNDRDLEAIRSYRRAADYLGAAQIYLASNTLLEEPLREEHLKPRLLGHWGTVPGINLIYAHLNRLIVTHEDASILLVTGPGHGAPANLANLFLEGSLGAYYPDLRPTRDGAARLIRRFSWPGGFPSHLVPMTPGVIHEGGELGYALAKAFGAAFDHPELVVACIVGDGEAETGPTATAWHGTKFLDPATSGAVLPILHVNGYKIASHTISSAMADEELTMLHRGYGWRPRIVEKRPDRDLDRDLADAFEQSYREIREIQSRARAGRRDERPGWPMVILRTPKGMGAPKMHHGHALEGSWRAHQVPIANAAKDPAELATLEAWLRSYGPDEIFEEGGALAAYIEVTCPKGPRRMGMNAYANGGALCRDLELPNPRGYAVRSSTRGGLKSGSIEPTGAFLRDVFRDTEKTRNFRIFCPDELTSNKLGAVLDAADRAFVWPKGAESEHVSASGRVVEVLSEHMCEGWLEGYLLAGGHGLFPCYEAFISIIDSMMAQHAKFLKQSREVAWRKPIASLNYLLTSDSWRQDHNGYSHQGPGFINALLDKKAEIVRIYLPPDANTLLSTIEHCLRSKSYINLIIATKNEMPQWLSFDEAVEHARAGASIWTWASTHEGTGPDVVLACAGTTPTLEVLAAKKLLERDLPELRVRIVNVTDLLVLDAPAKHPHGLPDHAFDALFPLDRRTIFAFHGYRSAVEALVFERPRPDRFYVLGYREEGTTTTPFDMTVRNGISRYHLAIEALRHSPRFAAKAGGVIDGYTRAIEDHRAYIERNGRDPPEIADWTWS
jgi:xylulose-5-phosphate/fructose-6-phosphate phosphoketolase